MRTSNFTAASFAAFGLILGACGSSGVASTGAPWEPDQVTVVSPSTAGDPVVTSRPGDGECIEVADVGCVAPDEIGATCAADEAADIIVDAQGNVVDVVCLPPDAVTITPAELADGEIPQNANNTAVEFTGGIYEDDLVVDANNVVLYGEDPDDAVLEGDLEVTGNNTVVRGLTIDGDVTVVFNNSKFVFCRITGDVTITSNNTEIIGCEIFGNVTITGNNTVLHGNLIQGSVEISGKNTICDGENHAFVDENENVRVEDVEIGEPLDIECRPSDSEEEEGAQEEGRPEGSGAPDGL